VSTPKISGVSVSLRGGHFSGESFTEPARASQVRLEKDALPESRAVFPQGLAGSQLPARARRGLVVENNVPRGDGLGY